MTPEGAELEARLATLLAGRTGRSDERAILAILEAAAPAELSAWAEHGDLRRVLEDLDDHLTGPRSRTAFSVLLCRERLDDLSIAARARLLAALQRGRTCAADERGIADLLGGTRGEALFELKRRLDRGGSYRDLSQLVHRDVDAPELRARILAHFAEEARALPPGARGLRVVSDVDDTLWANWKDRRYPKKSVYPGVLAFYREVSRRTGDPAQPGELAFLTARPRDRAGLVEDHTHRTLRRLGVEGASVLSGPLRRIFSSASIARGKLEGLRSYLAIYPEDDVVFVGDSGQGDVEVAVRAREEANGVVRGAFIHDVVGTPPAERARLAALGVDLFDTYAGAAAHAHARGLLGREAALRVAARARAELGRIRFPDPARAAAARVSLEAEEARLGSSA